MPRTEISALQDLLRQLVLSISRKHKVTGRELAITKAHRSPFTVTFLQTFRYNCSAQLSTVRTWLRQQGRGDETWRSGLRCAIVLCRQNSTEYTSPTFGELTSGNSFRDGKFRLHHLTASLCSIRVGPMHAKQISVNKQTSSLAPHAASSTIDNRFKISLFK